MAFPPVYDTANVSSVQAVLGTDIRFYPFGRAPQGVTYPYAVYQTISGTPQNVMDQTPDMDYFGVQVDVYATPTQGQRVARGVLEALRDAIEPYAHITSWRSESVDPDTKSYRIGFDCDWWVPR